MQSNIALHMLMEASNARLSLFLPCARQNRELQIMRMLAHPNVVDLYAFFYSNGEKVGSRHALYVASTIQKTVPPLGNTTETDAVPANDTPSGSPSFDPLHFLYSRRRRRTKYISTSSSNTCPRRCIVHLGSMRSSSRPCP